MIESPLIDELQAEARAQGIARSVVQLLTIRFGAVSPDLEQALLRLNDESRLIVLHERAARCSDLEAFRAALRG